MPIRSAARGSGGLAAAPSRRGPANGVKRGYQPPSSRAKINLENPEAAITRFEHVFQGSPTRHRRFASRRRAPPSRPRWPPPPLSRVAEPSCGSRRATPGSASSCDTSTTACCWWLAREASSYARLLRGAPTGRQRRPGGSARGASRAARTGRPMTPSTATASLRSPLYQGVLALLSPRPATPSRAPGGWPPRRCAAGG